MTVEEKLTIKHSEALRIAREARDVLLDRLSAEGHNLEVGERDGDNNLLTPRRIGALKGGITRAGMAALKNTYTIIPDEK